MDAPKKIYIHPDIGGREFIKTWLYRPANQESVEYVRKDSFIERAADYIKRHSALLDSDGNDCMPEWIENFKKAMKL